MKRNPCGRNGPGLDTQGRGAARGKRSTLPKIRHFPAQTRAGPRVLCQSCVPIERGEATAYGSNERSAQLSARVLPAVFEVFIFWRQALDFQFHPAAAEAINQKSAALLEEVRLLRFSKSKKEQFVGDRVSTAITDKDILGHLSFWAEDDEGSRVYSFIQFGTVSFGLTSAAHGSLVPQLVAQVLKASWARNALSIRFVEDTIIEWLRLVFGESAQATAFADYLVARCQEAVKTYTVWAPIANLEVEIPIEVGPAKIAPMSRAFFDQLEEQFRANPNAPAASVDEYMKTQRSKMQGIAAVVLNMEAEEIYAYENGLRIADDVVGLFRFLSPAANKFWVACPMALLGAELSPSETALLFNSENRLTSERSRLVDKEVAYMKLPANTIESLKRSQLVRELGKLVLDPSNEFAVRVKSSILAFTKGITFFDVADRLVYTFSSLESLLLKNTSEPIQQNLGERMAFLIAKDAVTRRRVVANVKDAYQLRSNYVHHRRSEMKEETLLEFTSNAHKVLHAAIGSLPRFATPQDFIDAIDDIKFGGGGT
jgi:hypothetical protein